jgi:hypothetical protein
MIEPRKLRQIKGARKGGIENDNRSDPRLQGAVEKGRIGEIGGYVLRHVRVPSLAK